MPMSVVLNGLRNENEWVYERQISDIMLQVTPRGHYISFLMGTNLPIYENNGLILGKAEINVCIR